MYRFQLEQQRVVEKAREIAESVIARHASRVDEEGSFPRESIQALGEAGFLGLTISSEYGGMGQGQRSACAVIEEVARCCASTAMVYLMHLCGVACYLSRQERFKEVLRQAAAGNHLSTLAFSESGSRSHFWAPLSKEDRRNGQVLLTAKKSFVTSAGEADGYVVSTGWLDSLQPTDSMLYLVLKQDGYFPVEGPWKGLGMRGNASSPMEFKEIVLDQERAISGEGKGFQVMLEVVLPVFQLGSSAVSLGIAEAAVQATQRHLTAGRLEHLNSRLADLPNQRARLAQMRIAVDQARAHIVSVLDAIEDQKPNAQLLILESKAVASAAALKVTEIALRACGGAAFSKQLGVERNFRDAQASVVMAPTTDHLHDFIGRALCGMELF